MLKITRRPYTSCAYRWALSTSGINTGEGDCSEAQCLDLNGDFLLDFSACESKGGNLIWEGDCEPQGDATPSPCVLDGCPEPLSLKLPWTPPSVEYTEAEASIEWYGAGFSGTLQWSSLFYDRTSLCEWSDYHRGDITTSDPESVAFPPPTRIPPGFPNAGDYSFWIANGDGTYHCPVVLWARFLVGRNITITALINENVFGAPFPVTIGFLSAVYRDDSISCESSAPTPYTLDDSATLATTAFEYTGEVDVTYAGKGDGTGPDKNDRIRSKWHLDYDIDAQLWTLRSFERIDYPVYTLSDASPCDGDTKTLNLADRGSSADGCGVAPAEMTITRVCPPDRVGKSALLDDRKPNGATGKRKRQCGCDCLDEVDDRRHTCATKCASSATEGCERIDPAPDDITCRYPEAINCCEPTAGKDVPCAYTVEFECDLFYDIEDVRHKIAAKQVTLRRECYFEDPCLFVAPGAESSTGGSPVMDVDGYPGAQPVCSSCADLCLTGCTWSAWTVAACPEVVACGLTYCGPLDEFTIEIPSHTGNPCDGGGTSVPAITITLTYDSTSLGGALFRGTGTLATGAGDVEARVLMYLSENCTDLSVYIGGAVPCDPVAGTGWDYYDKTPSILSECPTTIVFRYTSAIYGAAPPTELQTLTVVRV